MGQIDESELTKDVLDLMKSIVPRLLSDPNSYVNVRGISVVRDYSTGFDRWYKLIKVEIETNNRALLLGQFWNIPEDSKRGLFSFYYSGLIDGLLYGKYGEAAISDYALGLDIHQLKSDKPLKPWRFQTLTKAISEGIMAPDSLLAEKMREHNLTYVLLLGSALSGPSLDMMYFVEDVMSSEQVHKVLDLFSGTGTSTKICFDSGAEYSVAVDINPEVIERNVGPLQGKQLQVLRADAFDFVPAETFDLIIVDPFYDDTLTVTKKIIPRLLDKTRLILLDVGCTYESSWISAVSDSFQQHVTKMRVLKGKYSVGLLGYVRS